MRSFTTVILLGILTAANGGGGAPSTDPAADMQVGVPVAPVAAAARQEAPDIAIPVDVEPRITYSLGTPREVKIGIYDSTGSRVRVLDEGPRESGVFTTIWDGRDDAGRRAEGGAYFYRIEGVSGVAPRRMVLLK